MFPQPTSSYGTGNAVKALTHVPRLLALDGGGVRGLSSRLILEKLMKEVQRLREEENDLNPNGKPPLPCQYFDLICGTSTGRLIAIMLGRLRMVFLLLWICSLIHSLSISALKNISNSQKLFSAWMRRCSSPAEKVILVSRLRPLKRP